MFISYLQENTKYNHYEFGLANVRSGNLSTSIL